MANGDDYQPRNPAAWNKLGYTRRSEGAVQAFRTFAGSITVSDLFEGDPTLVERELEGRWERLNDRERQAARYSYEQLRRSIRDARRAQRLTAQTEQIRGYLEGGAAERGGGFLEGATDVAGEFVGHGQAAFNALQWIQRQVGSDETIGGGLSETVFGPGGKDMTVGEAQARAKITLGTVFGGTEHGRRLLKAQEDIQKLLVADATRRELGLAPLLTEKHLDEIRSLGLAPEVAGKSTEAEIGSLLGFLAGARFFGGTVGRVPVVGGVTKLPGQIPGPTGRILGEATTFGLYEGAAQRDPAAVPQGAAFGAVAAGTGEVLGAAGRAVQRRAGARLAQASPEAARRELFYRAAGQAGAGLEQLSGRATPYALGGRPALRPNLASLAATLRRTPETAARYGARTLTEYTKLGSGGTAAELTRQAMAGEAFDLGQAAGESFGAHTAGVAALFGLGGKGGGRVGRQAEIGGRRRARERQEKLGEAYPRRQTGLFPRRRAVIGEQGEVETRRRPETKKEWFRRLRAESPTYTRFSPAETAELYQIERLETEAAKRKAAVKLTERQRALKERAVRGTEPEFGERLGLETVAERGGTSRKPPEFAPTELERRLRMDVLREPRKGILRLTNRWLLESEGRTLSEQDVVDLRAGRRPEGFRSKFRPEIRQWLREFFIEARRQAVTLTEPQGPPEAPQPGTAPTAVMGKMLFEPSGTGDPREGKRFWTPEMAREVSGLGQLVEGQGRVELETPRPERLSYPLAQRMEPLAVAQVASERVAEVVKDLQEKPRPGSEERLEDIQEDLRQMIEAPTPEAKKEAQERLEAEVATAPEVDKPGQERTPADKPSVQQEPLSEHSREVLQKYASDRAELAMPYPTRNGQRVTDLKEAGSEPFTRFLQQYADREPDGKVPPKVAWGLILESEGIIGTDAQRLRKLRSAWEAWESQVGIRGGREAFEEMLTEYQRRTQEHVEATQAVVTELVSRESWFAGWQGDRSTAAKYLQRYVAETLAGLDSLVNHSKSYQRARARFNDRPKQNWPNVPAKDRSARIQNFIIEAEKAFGLHNGDAGSKLLSGVMMGQVDRLPSKQAAQWYERYLDLLANPTKAWESADQFQEWQAIQDFIESAPGAGVRMGKAPEASQEFQGQGFDAAMFTLMRHAYYGRLGERYGTGDIEQARLRGSREELMDRYEELGLAEKLPREVEIPEEYRDFPPETLEAVRHLLPDAPPQTWKLTPKGRDLLQDLQRFIRDSGAYRGVQEQYSESFFNQRENSFDIRCLSACGQYDRVWTEEKPPPGFKEIAKRGVKRLFDLTKIHKWRRTHSMMERDLLLATSPPEIVQEEYRPFFRSVFMRALAQTWSSVVPRSTKASEENYTWAAIQRNEMLKRAFYSPHADRSWTKGPREFEDPEGFAASPNAQRMRDMSEALNGNAEAWARLSERDFRWAQDLKNQVLAKVRPEIVTEIFRKMETAAKEAQERGSAMWGAAVPEFVQKWDSLAMQVHADGKLGPLAYDVRTRLASEIEGPRIIREMIEAKRELEPGEYRDFQFGDIRLRVAGWGLADYLPHVWVKRLDMHEQLADLQSQLHDATPHPGHEGNTRSQVAAAGLYASAYPHARRPKVLRHMLRRTKDADGWVTDIPWLLEQYIGRTYDYIARSRTLDVVDEELYGRRFRMGFRDDPEVQAQIQRTKDEHGDEWEAFLHPAYKRNARAPDVRITPQGLAADGDGLPTHTDAAMRNVHGILSPHFMLRTEGVLPRDQVPEAKPGWKMDWYVDWNQSSLGKHASPYFKPQDRLVLVAPNSMSAQEGPRRVTLTGKQILKAKLTRRRGGLADVIIRRGGSRGWNDLVEAVISLAENRNIDVWKKEKNSVAQQAGRSIRAAADFIGRMIYRGQLGGVGGINSKAALVNALEGIGVQNMAAMGGYAWMQGSVVLSSLAKHTPKLTAAFYADAMKPVHARRGYHEILQEIANADPKGAFAKAWNYVAKDSPYRISRLRDLDMEDWRGTHEGGIVLNMMRHVPGVSKVAEGLHKKGSEVKKFLEERYDPIHFAWFELSELMTRMHLMLGYGMELGKRFDTDMNGGSPWQNPDTGHWYRVGNDLARRGEGLGTQENPRYLAVQDLVFDRVEATHFHYRKALMPGMMKNPLWGTVGHLGTYSTRLMIESTRDIGSLVRYLSTETGDRAVNVAGSQRLITRIMAFWLVKTIVQELSGLDLSQYGGMHLRELPIVDQIPLVHDLPDFVRISGGPPSFPSLPIKLMDSLVSGLSAAALEAKLKNLSGEGFGPGDWAAMIGSKMESMNPGLWIPDLGAWTAPASAFTIPFSRGVEPFLRAWTAEPDPHTPGNYLYGRGSYKYSIPQSQLMATPFIPGAPEQTAARYRGEGQTRMLQEHKGKRKREIAEQIAKALREGRREEALELRREAESLGLGPMKQSIQNAQERAGMTALRASIARAGDPQLRVRRALELWESLTRAEKSATWRDIFGKSAKLGRVPAAHRGYFQGPGNREMLRDFVERWRRR